MPRIRLTKKDINKAFSDALDTGQPNGLRTGLAGGLRKLKDLVSKKKAV